MTTPTTDMPGVAKPHVGLLAWLAGHDIEYELHEHPVTITALQMARAEHVDPRRVAKTLVVDLGDGRRALVVLDAADRLDLAKAARALEAERVRLLTEDELAELAPTVELGTLPPVGALFGLPVRVDHALHAESTITFPAGSHRFAVLVDRAAWEDAAGVVYADLAETADRGPAWAR